MTRHGPAVLGGLALAFCSLSTWPEELYRRAEILEERLGRIDLRSAYGVLLTLPRECREGEEECSEQRVYDEVLTLDFSLEHRELVDHEIVRTEEPRGTMHLALALAPGERETFEDELHGRLRQLSAQAFVQTFAGLGSGKPPLDETLAKLSAQPSWLCMDSGTVLGTRFSRRVERDDANNESVALHIETGFPLRTPLCEQMREATATVPAEIVLTLSVPAHLSETTVFYEDVVAIDAVDPEALAPRPSEIRLFKRPALPNRSGSADGGFEGYALSQSMGGGWRFDAFAKPAAMPLTWLDRNAWLQRWTIETIDRRLGVRPEERSRQSVLRVAYLAMDPPSLLADEPPAIGVTPLTGELPQEPGRPPLEAPAEVDRTAFLEELGRRLELAQQPDERLLEQLLKRPDAGLRSEGWLAVLCREDGSASYTVPPTRAEQPVTNADLFCAALEARLEAP